MKQWASLAAVALLAQDAAAQFNMLRFACSQLVVDRIDPIVQPGVAYSAHLHQLVGGNSLNLTMDANTYNPPDLSTCTSCNFAEDFSNYWTAVLFFKAKNGSYMRVPQVANGGPQGQLVNNGGHDVYYIPSGKTTAFKQGFRMIAGDATNTDNSKVNGGNICFRCWTSTSDAQFTGGAPCSGSDTVAIPTGTQCKMLRETIIFPACWDGKNLDSPDHQSHVTYSGTGATGGGACPAAFPVKLPQVMYEIMWNISTFMADRSNWATDVANPFMLSMGLGGSAAHGDYLFGWKGDALQNAMNDGCNLNAACPKAGLTVQTPQQYSACTKTQQAPEPVNGWLDGLPGINPTAIPSANARI